jgi:3-deoxy-manno-octulosonate cytidylyltransferase (CMP-KDO synthetase)
MHKGIVLLYREHINFMNYKVLILIPARYESSRFPGKPLAPIKNKPMIHYVVENCQKSGFDYAVVTDSGAIEDSVQSINGNIVRIDDDVVTGSERIALAYDRYFKEKAYDLVVNVQGDEPLLTADIIKQLVLFHENNDFDICTIVKRRELDHSDFHDHNIVKCIKSYENNQCLYFTRASAPHPMTGEGEWFQHIGVYCYKTSALIDFNALPVSQLEKEERLEQLRALENGMRIGALEVDHTFIGVDTPGDIAKIEGVLG